MSQKTGVVSMTVLVEKACKLITVYGPKLDKVIQDAETSGTITSTQAAAAQAFLSAAQAACAVFKLISGY